MAHFLLMLQDKSVSRLWRQGTEAVEWYSLPLRARILISMSIRRGQGAPPELRAIALKEAERVANQSRLGGITLVTLGPVMAVAMIWFLWAELAAVGDLRNAILILSGICVFSILRYKMGRKRLMRAVELNRDHPDDPATVALPSAGAD